MNTIFLQTNIAEVPEKLSALYLMKEGGLLMIPLFICSIIALYIFIERYLTLKSMGKISPDFISDIKSLIVVGNIEGAKNYCLKQNNATSRVIEKGISRIGKPIDVIEKSMESAGKREVYKMEKRTSVLSTIAGVAPMFGFLGTIAGMIILFYNVNLYGFNLKSISGGIYTKMVTSAVGLIIGLLSYLAYQFINSKINKNVYTIEEKSSDFIDILYEPLQ